MDIIAQLIFLLATAAFLIWIFVLVPVKLAKARGRSSSLWVFISILISPLVVILLLWYLGDAKPNPSS